MVEKTLSTEEPTVETKSTLQVEDLHVYYHTQAGAVKAVNGVTFSLKPGERFGLVGESGSGKSTIALALLRLIKPPGKIESGAVYLNGVDLVTLSEEGMRRKRLDEIALVAQGAMNSLNPVRRIRDQFILAFNDHDIDVKRSGLNDHIADLLSRVGLSRDVANMFPHELSGGMKQRVCIALAISLSPSVIIADEPTSALDVVVQWQVMDTLRRVQEDLGASVILIGHDMGLMAQFVDRLGVMYAGKLVEIATVKDIFGDPLHPYGQALIASLPSLDSRKERLEGIPGITPSLVDPPSGCPFHTRCPKMMEHCKTVTPTLEEVKPDHWVACHLYEEAR
ncbi:MAG: ABC transporter ATP-binding protein [Thermomicrobiaceae bacterium]